MTKESPTDALARLNAASESEFVQRLGGVFEHSPWVAECVAGERPFASLDALHAAMVRAVEASGRERQIALLRAHPELAGREARAGEMTDDSVSEQSSAGLDAMTREEIDRMSGLNAAYRGKFGFPFIIAVRNYTKPAIFAEMARRLGNDANVEIANDLEQVYAITRMRLERLLG